MRTESRPPKTFIERQKQFFTILISAQLLFATSVLALLYSVIKKQADQSLLLALSIAASIVTCMAVVLSYVVYTAKLRSARSKENIRAKLDDYRFAFLLRAALLLFPAFLSIVCAFITGSVLFLLLFAFVFLIQLLTRPTVQKISKELALSTAEMNQINLLE